MKKQIFFTLITIFMLLASACSPQGKAAAAQAAASPVTNSAANPIPAADSPNTSQPADNASDQAGQTGSVLSGLQLLAGIYKLEGTNLALTTEQASQILPLLESLRTLSQNAGPGQGTPPDRQSTPDPQTAPQTSNTENQNQTEDILSQIQAVLTADQTKAIQELNLTPETIMTYLQELGIGMGLPGGQQASQGNPPQNGTPQGNGNQPPQQGNGGQPPQGNPPTDGQQPGNPPSGNNQQGGSLRPGGGMLPNELIDLVINLVQTRMNISTSTPSAMSAGGPGMQGGTTNNNNTASTAILAAYKLDGGSAELSSQDYSATADDTSAILVINGGTLTLSNSKITTSGNTSSEDQSSFYGLNAAVLAEAGSTIHLSDSSITTTGSGANGAFATGTGSLVTLKNVTINATGDAGHGVMATNQGVMTLTDVDINTTSIHAGAIATDRGSGTITATGGTVTTSGQDSPGIYSTGNITVSNAVISATGSESAVIEGGNSITLTDTSLTSSLEDKWGVMIYQSMSGDAEGTRGTFSMTGGSLAHTAKNGPLFFVTNSTGIITLKGVDVTANSGMLVQAGATSRWGNSGSNGGTVILTGDGQALTGSLTADKISSISLILKNGSTLTGSINADQAAGAANLTLDASSTWTVSADSTLDKLVNAGVISGSTISNIIGNGHTVYYDASLSENSYLNGQTYNLTNGGQLTPIS